MKGAWNGKSKVEVKMSPKATICLIFLDYLKEKIVSVHAWKTSLVNNISAHNFLDHLS